MIRKILTTIIPLLVLSSTVLAVPMTFIEMNSIGDYVVPLGEYYYDDANSTITGSFEVFDIAYSNNNLLRFAATFEQNDRIFGRISYNSDAFSVPESGSTILLGGMSFLFLAIFRRRTR